MPSILKQASVAEENENKNRTKPSISTFFVYGFREIAVRCFASHARLAGSSISNAACDNPTTTAAIRQQRSELRLISADALHRFGFAVQNAYAEQQFGHQNGTQILLQARLAFLEFGFGH